MSIIRTIKNQNYSVVNNIILGDERLSWRARGIAAYLFSRPDNWRINSENLTRMGTEGRDAVRTAMNELKDAGYLQLVKTRNDDGTWATELVLHETPQGDRHFTGDGLSGVGLPGVGAPGCNISTDTKYLYPSAHANAVLDDSPPTATTIAVCTKGIPSTQTNNMATQKQHSPNVLPLMVEKKPETLGNPQKGNAPQPHPPVALAPPAPSPKRAKKADSNPTVEACWQAYLLKIEEYEPGATLNFARERKAINDLAKQWTPEQVSECFDKMKADSFWADKHLSVQSMASQIAAKLNGHAAKTNGHERIDKDLFYKNFSQGDLYS